MKKLLIVAIIFCSLNVVSSAQDTLQNAFAIQVKQDYECWNKCDGGYPHLDKMTVTIGGTETKESAGIIQEIDDKHHSAIFTKKLEKEDFTFIAVKDETRGFGRKHNTFTYTATINSSELHLGENKNIRYYSDAVKCSCCHREGYSITTSVIIDRAIDVNIEQDSSTLTVEEGELELTFSEFYDSRKNIELQYMCNDSIDKSWRNVARQPHITSGGKVKLRYEDIVGKYSDSNERYKNCIGKYIDFRVVKTLLDGTETYGEIVNARFYHNGPEFEIADIRRPFCEDINPLQIRVKFGNDVRDFSKMANLPGYEWIIKDSTYTFMLNRCGDPDVEGYRVLNGVQSSESVSIASSLSEYLKEPNIGKNWTIKLQYKPEGEDEVDAMMPVSKEFILPDTLPKIKVKQSDGYLFELDGKKYHLFNKHNPYVVLKITDNDTIEPGRMPYTIKNQAGKVLATITEKAEEPKLNIDTDEEFNAKIGGEEQRVAYIKNKIKQLYEKYKREDAKELYIYKSNNNNYSSHDYSTVYDIETTIENIIVNGPEPEQPIESTALCYVYSTSSNNGVVNVYTFNSNYALPNLFPRREVAVPKFYGSGEGVFYFENNELTWKHNDGNETKKTEGAKHSDLHFVDQLCLRDKTNSNIYILSYDSSTAYIFHIIGGNSQTATMEVISISNSDVVNGLKKFSATFRNDGSFFWLDSENNKINLYANDKVTTYKTYSMPDDLSVIDVTTDSVRYTSKGTNYIQLQRTLSPDRFYNYFIEDKTIWSSHKFDNDWEVYRQRRWQQYLLQKYGYHIHGINVNQDDKLTLVDNDGCSYTIPYRVNVLDGLNVNLTDTVKPHDGLSNGSIRLDVYPGGDSITYYYKKQKVKGHITDNLTNLPWGETIIPFTDESGDNILYTHSLFLLPNVTFEVKPQTCSSPNGEIIVKGVDATNCTQWQHKNVSMPDSEANWRSGLNNLKAGEYKVRGFFSNGLIPFDTTLIVRDEIFDVSVKSIADATTIGGKGSVELKIENQIDNILWYDDSTKTEVNYLQATFTPRTYNWIATHALDWCVDTVSFVVRAPHVELVNSMVTYDIDTKEVHIHMEGEKNDFVSSYQFMVDGETFANDITLSGKNVGDTIKLGLKYKTSQGEYTTDIATNIKLSSYTPKAIVNTDYNNKRCPSQLGQITLENAEGGYWKVGDSENDQYEYIETNGTKGLPSGTYNLHFRKEQIFKTSLGNITYYSKCSQRVIIAEANKPSIQMDHRDVSCHNDTNGQIFIASNKNIRGEAQFSFDNKTWHSSSDTIMGLAPKTYHICTRDSKCPSDSVSCDVVIERPASPLKVKNIKVDKPTCKDNDGVIKVEASGGWDQYLAYTKELTNSEIADKLDTVNVENNLSIVNLKSGSYKIYVHDIEGCYIEIDTVLPKYVSPKVVSAYDVPTRCNGTSDGAIIITQDSIDCFAAENLDSLFLSVRDVDGAEIRNSVYNRQIDYLSAGTYWLKLTDRVGCSGTPYSIVIHEPAPLTISLSDTNAVRIKKKGGEGAAEISVSGGNIGYKYVVAHGDTIQQSTDDKRKVSGFKAGKSSVWAIDAKDCHSNTAQLTFIEPEDELTFKATAQDARCHTETGSIAVTAQGGWNDYTIKIDGVRERKNVDSLETITFEGLYAGKYTVTVTDAEDVSISDTIRVNAPEPIYQNYTIMPELCDDNGKVKIELSGGTKPYTSWFVLKTDTIYGDAIETDQLVGGRSYRLVTVDANTCVSELNFDLPDENLQVAIQTTYTSDGIRLTANATHGTAPYTYEWQYETDNVSLGSEKALIVTKGGIYRLDVTDASGCSRSVAEPIITEGSRMMRVVSHTPETGYERNDGTALIYSPIAPQHPRMYNAETRTYSNITANDTVISLTGLRPGEYIIESEQGDGSYLFAKFSIDKYIPMEFTQLDITPVTIKGGHDGKVVIKFEGGLAPFTLDGKTYPNGYIELDSLAAGTLHLVITDIAGNELNMDTTIQEPQSPLVIRAKDVYNAQCHTYSDGNVTLEASGGWGNYQFAMGDSAFVISSYFGDLNAGERIFRVVDRYGVMDSVVVSITEPDQLVASIAKIDSVTCKGLSNGKVYFDVTGGTQPYYVLHDDNKLKSTEVSHLRAGRYIMKITDSHRCEAADSVEVSIPEPEKLTIERVDITHTTCDLDNGAIGISLSGGSLPYTYQWTENGKYFANTKDISNLKQNGIYALTVSDSHNCVDTITRRVNDSRRTTIGYVYTQDATCFGYADGVAKIEPTYINAGKPAATYRLFWPQNISDVMGVNTLTAGNYSVRLEDTNGCADSTQFSIGEPVALSVNIGNDIVICPGSAHVLDAGLHTKYLWAADGNPIDNDQRYLTIDEAGEYSVEVRNEIGCFARDTMTLGIGDDALEAYFLMSTEVALGDTVALIEMANMAVDSLHWEFDTKQLTDVTTEDAEQYLRMLKPENVGTVYITMWAYANGCVTSDTKELDVYASSSEELDWDLGFNPLIVSAKATPNPCDGEFDLHVQLREVADIEVTVNHVSTTTRVARTTASGNDHYVLHLNIGQYGKGIYVLSLSCGDERRVAKILVK